MPLTHRVDNQSQACTFQKRMASPQKDMELQRRNRGAPGNTRTRSVKLDPWTTTLESRVHVQTVGLNDKKISSAFSNEEIFFLTCPFIGSLRSGCLTWFQHRAAKARSHHFILIYGINGLLPTEVQGALRTIAGQNCVWHSNAREGN